jgi:hypothetical protein
MFTVGSNIHYYAVDHSPSLLWNSATWEISQALLPHLRTVLGGPGVRDSDQTIRRAIEIRAGIIQNPEPRTSCPFSTAQHNIRIHGSSNATTRGPEHPSLLICNENIE